MKFSALFAATVLAAVSLSSSVGLPKRQAAAPKYTPPPGSPGFYHGQSSAAVTFDNLSAFLDGKRLFIFSGEFHPWRLPAGIPAWRDVLQKMKAAGFNAVSVYLHWGATEGKQGSLDLNYFRSHSDFYQVAKEVGILVIVRPGPYINAETTGGGLPGWLTNNPAEARSSAAGYLSAWTPYITATAKAAAPFQYPNGPVIAMQIENEYDLNTSDPTRYNHMIQLENAYRANGITKVPLVHNDNGVNGVWASGNGMVDIYEWDSYPNGFNCANPSGWSGVNGNLNQQHMSIDPSEVWITAEFQGGSFDPWGGSGYQMCYDLINEQFANVFYKNNLAGGVKWQSFYMTFGGTNWGNLAEPTVYTSYDYGAPIKEDRTLTPKYNEMKLQALFLHASSDFLTASVISSGSNFSNNGNVWTTNLKGQAGTNFYVVRQTSNSNTQNQNFNLNVQTSMGNFAIPQFGGQLTLAGRESKVIVTNYVFGKSTLVYSTAEVMTQTTIDGTDYIVLYALAGQTVEAVLNSASTPSVTGSSSVKASSVNKTVRITGTASGTSVMRAGTSTVIVTDKVSATTFWNPRLLTSGANYDAAADIPSVLVIGPYLVRNATISGSTLKLNGDINATTPIQFIAPKAVTSLQWNGQNVALSTSSIGTKSGSLSFGLNSNNVVLPTLGNWQCLNSLPEVTKGFDDSSWTSATKTSTQRPYQPYGGKYLLYADEYGFHQGNTLYRGHFTGAATSIWLSVQGGFNFGYSVWVNSVFMGSSQGTNQYTTSQDITNTTWTFPSGSVNQNADNVVTVLFDQTGLEEDYSGTDSFKTPRGIRGYTLNGGTLSSWKLTGNFGGESFPDEVRGPLNEGGLYVERIGAHLPGFSTTGWTTGSACNPLTGISQAGVTAYRTTFNLNLPAGSDTPVALKFELNKNVSYRTVFFINGWQFGRFSSKDGPQDTFPLPQGILNHNGQNTILVTLWALGSGGAKMDELKLITTAMIQSSKEVLPGNVVVSPTFQQVRG